jgi:hypothetical protein
VLKNIAAIREASAHFWKSADVLRLAAFGAGVGECHMLSTEHESSAEAAEQFSLA